MCSLTYPYKALHVLPALCGVLYAVLAHSVYIIVLLLWVILLWVFSSYLVEKAVPLEDRQVAMSLLLELTLQRGTLSHILEALLLLLCLSDLPLSTPDKNRPDHKEVEEGVKGGPHRMERSSDQEDIFPLVLFLRRLASIPTPVPPFPYLKPGQEAQVGAVFS